MNGERTPDAEYVLARRVLLDALEALGDQRRAVTLVGAQAIYHHTGAADLSVAEYTTDGDLALNPGDLRPEPKLEAALRDAGFELDPRDIGRWASEPHELRGAPVRVMIDLMVPQALGGPGSRGARLGDHGNRAARKARGLEAALFDKSSAPLASLDGADPRGFEIAIAGPAALLVAKLHKIHDRAGDGGRARDKDALDVFRLLKTIATDDLATAIRGLRAEPTAAPVTAEAEAFLSALFATSNATGCLMLARAVRGLEPEDVILASCQALTTDLLTAIR